MGLCKNGQSGGTGSRHTSLLLLAKRVTLDGDLESPCLFLLIHKAGVLMLAHQGPCRKRHERLIKGKHIEGEQG